MAELCLLSYIRKSCKACRRPVPRLPCGNLLKSVHRMQWCDPSIAGQRRCAGRLKLKNKKARILSESGPLRTELGGCAAMRFPLPDALDPRSGQADASLSGRPGAWRRRMRPAIPSPQHVRTRPDPSWVGWFWRRSGISRWGPWKLPCSQGAGWGTTRRTVNSLYSIVNPLRE